MHSPCLKLKGFLADHHHPPMTTRRVEDKVPIVLDVVHVSQPVLPQRLAAHSSSRQHQGWQPRAGGAASSGMPHATESPAIRAALGRISQTKVSNASRIRTCHSGHEEAVQPAHTRRHANSRDPSGRPIFAITNTTGSHSSRRRKREQTSRIRSEVRDHSRSATLLGSSSMVVL